MVVLWWWFPFAYAGWGLDVSKQASKQASKQNGAGCAHHDNQVSLVAWWLLVFQCHRATAAVMEADRLAVSASSSTSPAKKTGASRWAMLKQVVTAADSGSDSDSQEDLDTVTPSPRATDTPPRTPQARITAKKESASRTATPTQAV